MAKFPLQTLLEVTQKRYDDAERRFQQANALVDTERQKLQVIENYRQEYQQKLLAAQQSGLGVTQWKDFQVFIAKLDAAIEQQQQAVDRAIQFVHSARQQWEEQRKKLKGFETLSERHDKTEQLKESRREQKQSDEFASKLIKREEQKHNNDDEQ